MELNQLFLEQNINLKVAFDAILDGVVVINKERNVLYFNRAANLITGKPHSKSHLEAPSFYGLYHQDEKTLYQLNELPSIRALRGEEVIAEPLFLRNEKVPEGKYLICNSRPLMHQDQVVGAVMTFRDVTEQVHLEREKERLARIQEEEKIKMETSSRLASMGQLMAEIAHEINNPLAAIVSSCWLMKKLQHQEGLTPEMFDHNISTIEATVTRMQDVVQSLKNIAYQSEDSLPAEYRFQDVWQDVKSVVMPKIRVAGIKLKVNEENTLFTSKLVRWRNQLTQILINLLVNAVDALEGQPEGVITVDLLEDNHCLICRVYDNGPGIPPEIQHKIFTLFFTTKPLGKGTGLGLSISKSQATKMGGSLRLNREIAPSCFELKVPLIFN